MTRIVVAALVGLVLLTWGAHQLTAPDESRRFYNGDRSNFKEIRP